MAFTSNDHLIDTGSSTSPTLRDQQHAARLFNEDVFRLAPKHKFLFHVAFGINPQCLRNPSILSTYGKEINMLVKAVDLPNFSIQTEMLNQYNRKKVVQFQHKPGDTSIKFHDDNMGLINQLWQNYYSYYYADSISATTPGAFSRNATQAFSTIPASYGFDAGSTIPFFSYIKIYQMARHEFVCYQLWNPMITSFNHNKLSYSDQGVNDFDMKIQCEAVSYTIGKVEADNPEGFGTVHYDTTPSPLQPLGAPNTIGGSSFVGINANANTNAVGALSSALAQVNTYQNSQQSSGGINKALTTAAGLVGVVGVGGQLLNSLSSAAGGLSGISFPGAGAIGDAVSSVGDAIGDAASSIGSTVSGWFS